MSKAPNDRASSSTLSPTSEANTSESGTSLDEVRGRLRGLGYLDHSVERYLLQDAMRPKQPVRTVLALALKVGVLGGAPLAALATFALAWAHQLFAEAPSDAVILLLHLLLPFVLGLGALFLVLGGVFALVLQISHARRIEMASMVAATVAASALLAGAAFYGQHVLRDLGALRGGLAAFAALVVTLLLIRVLHGGFLSLAIRLRDRPPERPVTRLVWQAVPAIAALAIVAVPVLVGGRKAPPAPSSLPALPGARVAIIGVDGVRTDDVEALLAGGDLPAMSARLTSGGVQARYTRSEAEPAAFWTTLVTGLAPAEHGLVAVDGYRPLGMRTTLTRTGWLRPYFATLGEGLGLVAHRPVLAPSRRVPAVWDLASRGGVPVLVVNWWGTFPAEPLPGLMVAHGGYQLLPDRDAGAVTPAADSARLSALAAGQPTTEIDSLLATVTPSEAERLRDRALTPDHFYRAAFDDGLDAAPRFAALYLPGLDIAVNLADLGSVTQAGLVRWQLAAVDRLVARLADEIDILVVVLDPGRTLDGQAQPIEGRALVWRRQGGCGSEIDARPSIAPAQVASALVRSLGLPQSREWPIPPAICTWSSPSLEIDSYGTRNPPAPPAGGDEYLENLRSLGYL